MTTPGGDSQKAQRNAGREADGGFIAIVFGLLLIPIMIFTALAVDVSSWYSRATELQRTADAAALAGVVWMPNLGEAQTNATPVLQQNGVVNGNENMTVSMAVGETGITSFKVCVTDTRVTQFFAAVFASPTKMTRCGTAQYNAPLQLGSPLNYFGGNSTLVGYVPGPQPAGADSPWPDESVFGPHWNAYSRCHVRDAYPTGTAVGYWNREGSWTESNWRYYTTISAGAFPNCDTAPPTVPDQGSFRNGRYCRVVVGGTQVGYWWEHDTGEPYPEGFRYRRGSTINNDYPECGYDGETTSPIPVEKSPNMWAAIESYNYGHHNGDAFSNKGDEYRDTGYWYSIDIPDSGVTGSMSIQAWDLAYNEILEGPKDRSPMGDTSGPMPTRMRVYKADTLKYDMSAIKPVTGCDTGWLEGSYSGNQPDYDVRWNQVCKIDTPLAGNRYYIQIQSTDDKGYGQSGKGANGYALRAVAGTYPATCLDKLVEGDVDCYGAAGSVQPRLSAYGDMEMYNGINSGQPTQFYLADVSPTYGGKTLEIKLFDPGDGAGSSWVTLRGPSTTDVGGTMIPASVCEVQYREYGGDTWHNVSLSSGPGGSYPDTCTVQTTTGSSNTYQDRWLRFRVTLPTDYGPTGSATWTKCDPNTADPTVNAGSCWWQISYYVGSGTLGDYTTWSAGIINDPVRLVR